MNRSFVEEIDFNEIKLEGVVGKGNFGTVRKGKWRNLDVAVKMIETEQEKKAFIVEVQLLSRVSHPNIVKLYGACTKMPVCLVMEYAEGGSLYNVLHCSKGVEYTAAHAMSWVLQCAVGVAYLHNMKPRPLVHRDLKPPNLLLVNSGTCLKICDFGTACDCHTLMTNNKGSAAWMAPEVFEGSQYSEKCDIFSWSIILWEVLTRKKPFHDNDCVNAFGIMWGVHNGKRPPLIKGCPRPIERLMTRCWAQDPNTRPSMAEIVDELTELCKYFRGADEPLTFLNYRVSDSDDDEEDLIFNDGSFNNETRSSGYRTVQTANNEGTNLLITMDGATMTCPPDLPSTFSKEDKKRHSADFSHISAKPEPHRGHRRSGSYDSHSTKWASNSYSAETSGAEQRNKDLMTQVSGGSAYYSLDPKLQPLQPVQSVKESVEIYEKHCKLAEEFLDIRNEVTALKERKLKLQKQYQEQMDSKYIEEYLQLKKEKEGLLQLRDNLRHQLQMKQNSHQQQQQQQLEVDESNDVNNNNHTGSGEWVVV